MSHLGLLGCKPPLGWRRGWRRRVWHLHGCREMLVGHQLGHGVLMAVRRRSLGGGGVLHNYVCMYALHMILRDLTHLAACSPPNQRGTSSAIQHCLSCDWVSPCYQLVAPLIQVNLYATQHQTWQGGREGGESYPGSGRGQECHQLGECLQVLVEAGTYLLRDTILLLVVLPQGHLQTQQPVARLQQAKLSHQQTHKIGTAHRRLQTALT